MSQIEIHKLPRVVERTALPMSVVWAKTKEEVFPPPVKLGLRACGWLSNEIDGWIVAKAAGKSDDEIRSLVKKMVAARQGVFASKFQETAFSPTVEDSTKGGGNE